MDLKPVLLSDSYGSLFKTVQEFCILATSYHDIKIPIIRRNHKT